MLLTTESAGGWEDTGGWLWEDTAGGVLELLGLKLELELELELAAAVCRKTAVTVREEPAVTPLSTVMEVVEPAPPEVPEAKLQPTKV